MVDEMSDWTEAVGRIAGPRWRAIIDAIELALDSGALKPGDRLPPQRDLARRLAINVGTVGRAYAEMQKSGLTTGEVGRGTFLNRRGAADGPVTLSEHGARRIVVDLSHNFPESAALHPAAGLIASELAAAIDMPRLLASQIDAGIDAHRRIAAGWLRHFGIDAAADDMTITCGGQHGLLLSVGALTRPGDVILTEELTFYGLKSAAAMMGRSLVGVRMDREGVMPDYLDNMCRRTGAKILFCTPTLHNPTTATMSQQRRRDVIAVCERNDVMIVEDDVYGFMPSDPPTPLAALAPERTVHISSMSKLVGPGLRIGFLKAPRRFHHAFGVVLRATTLMASPFNAEWASRILASAHLGAIISALQSETAARNGLAAEMLPSHAIIARPDAYYFCLKLPQGWSAESFTQAAEDRGVAVTPFGFFEVTSLNQSSTVRVCLNGAANMGLLELGLHRLRELLQDSVPKSLRTAGAI
jgi:DNA-binding transcriptional MocR family regulator